jgi:alkylhydroperoxidase family enzyme
MNEAMRVPPIRRDEWTAEIREILTSFGETYAKLGLSGDEREKDTLSPILSSVLQHPALARVFFPFARYLLLESTLDKRSSELLVVRVSWLWHSEYEWAQHSMIALRMGVLTDEELSRLEVGAHASGWSDKERALLEAIDQLRQTANLDDAAWQSLSLHFDQRQCIDVIFLVGGYALVGMYVNTFRVPLKEGMKRFKVTAVTPAGEST